MISVGDDTSFAGGKAASLRELPFASCYAYSPGDGRGASRLLCASVKTGLVSALLDRAIQADAEAERLQSIAGFFPAAALLVPVPGSIPSAWGAMTPSGRLALALWKRGFGKSIWFGLRRVHAVRKSATAAPGARPSIRAHFDTMAVDAARIPEAPHVILIDDVVTKGRTLLAAALRLREVFPWAEVRGFALMRTMGYAPAFDEFLMPCIGKIEWTGDDARRRP